MVVPLGAADGKTWGLLSEPLRHISNPRFSAVIFRATHPQIIQKGGLWDESGEIYPFVGGIPYVGLPEWRWPTGATISFAYLGSEEKKFDFQGAQIPYLGFDQLEHFSESQFFYMLSRNRSTCGVRPYIRATVNPDAESWVATFIEWWIDQNTGYPLKKRAGVIRWFIRGDDDRLIWANTKEELITKYGDVNEPDKIMPKSVTFIPADIYDNKILLAKDPGYLANLKALSLIDRERLLMGNWKIKPSAGKLVNRSWFEVVPAAPAGGTEIRFWDFAGTAKEIKGDDPDYTAGERMRLVKGVYYILDSVDEQAGPAEVDRMFVNLSKQDQSNAAASGAAYSVGWEIEGGSSGIQENRRLTQMVAGIPCRGRKPTGDKIMRGKAFASQAEAGNVKLVAGAWNDRWLTHMHNQPDWPHDDIWDATVGAFNELTAGGIARKATSRQG